MMSRPADRRLLLLPDASMRRRSVQLREIRRGSWWRNLCVTMTTHCACAPPPPTDESSCASETLQLPPERPPPLPPIPSLPQPLSSWETHSCFRGSLLSPRLRVNLCLISTWITELVNSYAARLNKMTICVTLIVRLLCNYLFVNS